MTDNMGAGEGREFSVTEMKKDVVAAALPLQEHWLPLSNLDLLLPQLDVAVFFCFDKPVIGDGNVSFGSVIGFLKKALGESLVSYYAFAGEVVQNSGGEPELLCNNQGVDFIEAVADIELRELNLYNADEVIEGKLVPKKKQGVLAVQVTEFACGGLVVSCVFDHRIADGYSANMFLVSWAEMAQSNPISRAPSFRRSVVNPRRPLSIDPWVDDVYVPITSLPPPKEPHPSHCLTSRIYYVTAEQLGRLQTLASSDGTKRTKLESFSAFLWKMVAQCSNGAGEGGKTCKMGIVVDGRGGLSEGDKAVSLASYFGNVLSIPFGAMQVGELIDKPLSRVAEEVHEFLQKAKKKEHFLSLIDWVEAHRPVPGVAKIYCSGKEDGPAFVVSSGQRFPISKVDFGWGKPIFGSYHFPWGGEAGYVMPMPSPAGNGDWVVYMHLFKEQLEFIETEASYLFKPFTFSCVYSP